MKKLSSKHEAFATLAQVWPSFAMELITIDSLTVAYSGVVALKNVNFDIGAGEIVTIVGPNGSGKTSLLKAIMVLSFLKKAM